MLVYGISRTMAPLCKGDESKIRRKIHTKGYPTWERTAAQNRTSHSTGKAGEPKPSQARLQVPGAGRDPIRRLSSPAAVGSSANRKPEKGSAPRRSSLDTYHMSPGSSVGVSHSRRNSQLSAERLTMTELPPINARLDSAQRRESREGSLKINGSQYDNLALVSTVPIQLDPPDRLHAGGGGSKRSQLSPGSSQSSGNRSAQNRSPSRGGNLGESLTATDTPPGLSPRVATLLQKNGVGHGSPRGQPFMSQLLQGEMETQTPKGKPPPRPRIHSMASTANNGLSQSKRSLSSSCSNLAKTTDYVSSSSRPVEKSKHATFWHTPRRQSAMKRVSSDQNLANQNNAQLAHRMHTRPRMYPTRQQSTAQLISGVPNRPPTSHNPGNNKLTKVNSDPQMQSQSDMSLTPQNLRNIENQYKDNIADSADSDPQRDDRIYTWLLGVEGEADRPDSPPRIVDDAPRQRDTAIHIIYDGD